MDFDFGTEEYKEPVQKSFMSNSGFLAGKISHCEYIASYEAIDLIVEGEAEKVKNRLFMKNKDGSFSDGYYHFMSMCKLIGVDKPDFDSVTDRAGNIEGKPITIGVKFVFINGEQYPKQYVQSIHSSKTGCTYGEAIDKKPADVIKVAIKDQYKGYEGGIETSENTGSFGGGASDVGEAPAGFGGGSQAPVQPQMPVDEDLPF